MRRWFPSHQNTSHQYLEDGKLPVRDYWSTSRCAHSQHEPLRLVYVVLVILILGLGILAINVYQLHILQKDSKFIRHPVPSVEARGDVSGDLTYPRVWIHGRNLESGYLNHVHQVFRRVGYHGGLHAHTNWDVLWAHDYPFQELEDSLKDLRSYQKVNHFPGSGYITNKVSLATSNITYNPTAFRMPQDKEALMHYAKLHPHKMFVQKNNKHRGIKVELLAQMNLTQDGFFIQEFIQNPLLIDERKFDIGIYVVITSIDPLRVYIYNGDALLRFCPSRYHPFDPEILGKYVVGDEYLPTWEVASLKHYYEELGYTMKESLNAYLRSLGKDPKIIWLQIEDAIRQVVLDKEPKLIAMTSTYKSSRNFFEMMRFDFVVDDDLKVHIMEANMSPNLSSLHFPRNKLLYEQVIYNVLSLLGLAHWMHIRESDQSEDSKNMRISLKDLTIEAEICKTNKCNHTCQSLQCNFCRPCLTQEWNTIFQDSYNEHVFKHNCRRIFPPSLSEDHRGAPLVSTTMKLNEKNALLLEWFRGKCLQDRSWCQ